eukprot:TRINITY_DN5019_c0_g1_i4.p1 TRINITY_DN5019_c0_g1~~TRINITY_DN5019_c0_g1_i4.p1  ORF type:complete len:188 (+),score=23.25 TRINITY_DN5019_c0_g1_i4:183-746(+)
MVEQSLLDVVLNSRGHSTTVLNRVIYVAHVEKSSSDLSALEAFHKPLLNESFDDVSRCTGLLMHMGNDTVLHMLEGPSQSVEAFIQKLHNHTGPLSDIRVILSTEDIPNPAMPSWCVLQLLLRLLPPPPIMFSAGLSSPSISHAPIVTWTPRSLWRLTCIGPTRVWSRLAPSSPSCRARSEIGPLRT